MATDVLIRFDELKEQNPDIVAWIRSDDPESTGIDYPVLYSGDNEKYLRRDLYGGRAYRWEHLSGGAEPAGFHGLLYDYLRT